MIYLYVGFAGMLGALSRYYVGIIFMETFSTTFPIATLSVNLLGSYLLAWLTMYLFKRLNISPLLMIAISTGFIGSFTTFSTFSVETVQLLRNGEVVLAIIYIGSSAFGGLHLARMGFALGEKQYKQKLTKLQQGKGKLT